MDLIIYSDKNDLTEGMFGQCLTWLLEILYALEHTNSITEKSKIIFDVNALAYDNLIPRYIVPKKTYDLEELQDVKILNIKAVKSMNRIDFDFHENSFLLANRIWNKYFDFSTNIKDKIPSFDGTKTLGLHYRGTDKNTDLSQANPMTHEEVFLIVEDFLSNNTHIENIYCCSDEQQFIDKMIVRFAKYNIIHFTQIRSMEGMKAFFREGQYVDKILQDEMTIAALVDMIALSKCDSVLKTSSALSAFSKIINPRLNLYAISAMKQRWFPTGLVSSYNCKSNIVNNILNRTMYGHVIY